jgi:exosome complex RNA-binding protein Rrp4
MRINVGDLVYRKVNQYINSRHNNEIWLVLGKGKLGEGFKGVWVHIQNAHNGNKLSCRESMLMKIETEAAC